MFLHYRTLWNKIHESRYTFNSIYLLALIFCLWTKEFGTFLNYRKQITGIISFEKNFSWVSERQKSCEIFCFLFSNVFSLSEILCILERNHVESFERYIRPKGTLTIIYCVCSLDIVMTFVWCKYKRSIESMICGILCMESYRIQWSY